MSLGIAAGRAGAAVVLHGHGTLVEELHQLADRVRAEEEGVDGARRTREARHQGRVSAASPTEARLKGAELNVSWGQLLPGRPRTSVGALPQSRALFRRRRLWGGACRSGRAGHQAERRRQGRPRDQTQWRIG